MGSNKTNQNNGEINESSRKIFSDEEAEEIQEAISELRKERGFRD